MQHTLKVVRYIARISNIDLPAYSVYEDGIECSETSAHKLQTPGESPKRKNTTFRTGRKINIKKDFPILTLNLVLNVRN